MTTAIDIYGVSDQQFRREVQARFGEPVKMPEAEVATIGTLYPAADWEGCVVYLSDGASNKYAAVSNGTAWFYLDGSAV